ncbi:MAG: hypothetical protein WDO13_03110 [Verrucomicrobiota bacterium]
MLRVLLALAVSFALALAARAEDGALEPPDDGPPISITSPDVGSTYVFGTLKGRQLYWDARGKMLMARVTFTDADLLDNNAPQDDTHDFRLPGVNFDAAKGIFSAITAKGEVIPVARIRKTLFIKSIEVLPNARVRVIHERGTISVVLEAISPNDPAMHPSPTNPNGEHSMDINKILN